MNKWEKKFVNFTWWYDIFFLNCFVFFTKLSCKTYENAVTHICGLPNFSVTFHSKMFVKRFYQDNFFIINKFLVNFFVFNNFQNFYAESHILRHFHN